ncbi:MAG TPA: hypothetical protein VI111_05640, partial [Thermoleophilaceae bacterium]
MVKSLVQLGTFRAASTVVPAETNAGRECMGKLGGRALVLLAAALSMLVIAACGSSDDSSSSSSSDSGGGGDAKSGGSITISQTSQPDYLDPALTYTVNGIEPLWLVYTPLLTY